MNKTITLLILFCCCLFCDNSYGQNDTMQAINKWTNFYSTQQWDSAIFYVKRVQTFMQIKFGELNFYNAEALLATGDTYVHAGDPADAYTFFKKSATTFAIIKDTSGLYRASLLDLGIIGNRMGAYNEAIGYLLQCAELSEKSGDIDNFNQSRINLANIYEQFGDYSKAALLYNDIQSYIDTLPKNLAIFYQQFIIYNNLAAIYLETGDVRKALVYFRKAEYVSKHLSKKEEFCREYIILLTNLSDAYITLHNTDSATVKCKEAEDSLVGLKDSFLSSYVLAEEAHICIEKKQFAKAIQLSIQSLNCIEEPKGTDNVREGTKTSLGMLYCQTGQYYLADSIFKKQVKQLRYIGMDGSYMFQQAAISQCKNLTYQQKYKEAFDSLLALSKTALTAVDKNFAGMSESEQLQFSTGFDVVFDMFFTLLNKKVVITTNNIKQLLALDLQRKSLVLTNQLALLNHMRNTDDNTSAYLFSAWLNMRQLLAKQFSLPYSDRFLSTDSLSEITDRLEKQISAKGLATGIKTNNAILIGLQQQAKSTASIEFVRFNYITKNVDADSSVYAAFVFKGGDTLPIFVPLCSEAALLKLMWGNNGKPLDATQLTQKLYTPGNEGAAALYKLIWQPLEKYLSGVTTIHYSPAGLLNNISLYALINGRGYLANSYTIRRFINLTDTKSEDSTEVPKAISLWGNMVYDALNKPLAPRSKDSAYLHNIASLAASGIKPSIQSKSLSKEPLQAFLADEITPIQHVFSKHNIPYSYYRQQDATEESFKVHATAINGVLHISTHGFYTPLDKKGTASFSPGSFIASNANPLFRCGLAFAGVNYYWMKGVPQPNREDGILTGYEAAQLDLHNVQLVTLSACETGLGDVTANEGNLGMQRAFKLAGAKNLLVSLWQVPAKATQQMLTKFYAYWLQGNSLSKALQLAEADTRKIHPEPFFWAGFVLVE